MFDRYMVVDWSAANRPRIGRDSIWICSIGVDGDSRIHNPRTRGAAREEVRDLLTTSVRRHERVLVGFDFPFGYPRGFAAALGLPGLAWRSIWDLIAAEIEDDPATNVSNRFEVADRLNRRLGTRAAFWGRPRDCPYRHLPATKTVTYATTYAVEGAPGLAEWRVVEQVLRDRRHRPQSAWQLLGAGSVGSQALTGIPVLAALRADVALAASSRIWPFEVGVPELPPGVPAIIYAEVWPSLYDVSAATGSCRDERQVRHLAERLRAHDGIGALAGMMRRVPRDCGADEGWILGASVPL